VCEREEGLEKGVWRGRKRKNHVILFEPCMVTVMVVIMGGGESV
jgi:hypothetical protein